jgi:Holliday junction resolvase-like predicted endonuclease
MIARDGDGLVVVEVRTAQTAFAKSPVHTVGPSKQRKLSQLAERYRMGCGWNPVYIRFDVIGIIRKGMFRRDVNWVRNAFEVTRS